MRFLPTLFTIFALAASSVVAQNALILAPADRTQVTAGSTFNVSIAQPDSNSSWKNVAIVVGLLNCAQFSSDGKCLGPSQELGTILYSGPFNPAFTTDPGTRGLPPHQNFTFTVPSDFEHGDSQLGVALFDLVGALLFPSLQTFNTTIVVN
ncbi:hypothetical protein D9757_009507 [Collybiopsis confluens]|uniref:Uncharacterized protein n=1 Tax=Collybiopsis confluens TaxID=2823264 RepID=A0A8H5H8M8_9AGAR|nr:hypothetical protein D9757_013805 [Collybiopsis confluens]KAF5378656.1 hypothetical protein D9757_009507 [Collybiopsis confluens]